jgi:hypothetical protein
MHNNVFRNEILRLYWPDRAKEDKSNIEQERVHESPSPPAVGKFRLWDINRSNIWLILIKSRMIYD